MRGRSSLRSVLMLSAMGVTAAGLLSGCASVTAIPLEPDGLTSVAGAQPGFRYFIPRPYLLVAEAPAAKVGGGTPPKSAPEGQMPPKKPPVKDAADEGAKDAARDGKPIGGAPADATNKKTDSTSSDGGDGTKPASVPGADISFQIGDGKTYIAKLVYLPDYSRPMAVELNTGLVGISKVDMTLQDGWMLTNVSANADNTKMGDVLTAAIQALSTSATGGASKAATAAAGAKPKAGAPAPYAPPNQVLRPGLYAFDYAYGTSRVWGLCAVAYFGPGGSEPATGRGACGPDYSRPIPPPVPAPY